MGDSIGIGVGVWKIVIFLYDFLVKTIVYAIAEVLFQRTGLIVLGVLALVAVGVLVVRSLRRA